MAECETEYKERDCAYSKLAIEQVFAKTNMHLQAWLSGSSFELVNLQVYVLTYVVCITTGDGQQIVDTRGGQTPGIVSQNKMIAILRLMVLQSFSPFVRR